MEQAQNALPIYTCHKQVQAMKINHIVSQDSGSAFLYPADDTLTLLAVDAGYMKKHSPSAGGYYVLYPDGYESFSPAEAFEAGYTEGEGGLSIIQERKYTVAGGKIINRATGKAIPADEPIMIFRAKDEKSCAAISGYMSVCADLLHRDVVAGRIKDFQAFQHSNPDLVREPDSDPSCLPVINTDLEDHAEVVTSFNDVLMGSENTNGWKLEELLSQLQREVSCKSIKIERDTRIQSKTVQNNNAQIIGLLKQAEALQRQSYAILDEMAENQGPLGTPRIGDGSK